MNLHDCPEGRRCFARPFKSAITRSESECLQDNLARSMSRFKFHFPLTTLCAALPYLSAHKQIQQGIAFGMKQKVYIETTIPSYLAGRPSRDLVIAGNQELTREWWDGRREDFDLYVSQFVLDEANDGDADAARRRLDVLDGLAELEINDEAVRLAEKLVSEGIVPSKAATDAAHIAIAAVNEMDYLLTWNCRHIANAEIMKRIYSLCEGAGYSCPVLCTPAELMGGD